MSIARRQMTIAEKEYKKIMQRNILKIGTNLVDQIMRNYRQLPNSRKPNAINNVKPIGAAKYRQEFKEAYFAVSVGAMNTAIDELGGKPADFNFDDVIKDVVFLGTFKNLPLALRTKANKRVTLTAGTQVADLEKEVYFEFLDEIERTDSEIQLQEAMLGRVENMAEGRSVSSGSSLLASYSVSEARAEVFFSEPAKELMDALQFKNPSPVTAICVNLNGQIFSADQKSATQYFPPLHWGCKSILVPIRKGELGNREIGKLEPKGTGAQIKEANKSKQFSDTLEVRCPCCSK